MCCKCALREGEAMPVCTVCHVRRGKLPFPAFPASQSCMQGSWARQSPGPPPRSRVSPPRPSCFPCAPLPHIRFFFFAFALTLRPAAFCALRCWLWETVPFARCSKRDLKTVSKRDLKTVPFARWLLKKRKSSLCSLHPAATTSA